MASSSPDAAAEPLAIGLFGPFSVRREGDPLPPLRSRKGQWLLALLTLRHDGDVERAWLAGTLWPDNPESQALAHLRRCLTDLRQALGEEARRLRSPTPHTLALDLEGAAADVVAFDAAVARGDVASLETAVALYGGPLLEDCQEAWVFHERQARLQAYLGALEALAGQAMGRDDPAAAVGYLRRAVAVDPLADSAQRALMQALAAGGDTAAATQVYRDFRLLLHQELNAEPSPETVTLYQQLRAAARGVAKTAGGRRQAPAGQDLARSRPPDTRDLPAALPPLRSVESPVHNLPVQWTSFIGRERQIAELTQLLATHRMVTLSGAGGCGKTRLALQVAADLVEEYANGVWLVELAPLTDPTLVPQMVAAVLGVREEPSRSVTESLRDSLRPRSLLLVLDNCEHLLTACAQLADTLLRSCPEVRILATSREGLGIAGERSQRVPSLSVPAVQHLLADASLPAKLLEYEAVQLFAERALYCQPEFAITPRNGMAVAQVCHRLEGIPLAIELAAARVKALPVEQLAQRLDDVIRLLTGGSRTALPRQQTLRAMIDWSYDLLSEPERILLRRLSVFAGGWTLEAAEAVCSNCGLGIGDCALSEPRDPQSAIPKPQSSNPQSGICNEDVLDLLTQLVDKSLVIYEEQSGAARYRLLETVRQYARDRLMESGEAEAVRDRHLRFFVQLAERAQWNRVRDSDSKREERYAQMAAEQSNLRTALGWSLEKGENAEAGLRLAGQMGHFWVRSHQFQEGREWLEELLKRSGGAPPGARANALEGAGRLAGSLDDYRSARSYFEESLVLFRELEDREHTTYTLERLAQIAGAEGDLVSARCFAEEGLAISRESGNKDAVAWGLAKLGGVACWEGDYPRGKEFYEAALTMGRELGDSMLVGYSLLYLGLILRNQADYGAARSSIAASLKLWCESYEEFGLGHIKCLEALAQVAVAQRQYERMARLFGAAEALREAIHAPLPLVDRADYDGVAEARQVLGEAAFAAAWAEGRAMSLEEAVAFALHA